MSAQRIYPALPGRLVLVPPADDRLLLAREPGGGRVPTHSWLERLPTGLAVSDREPCSECPTVGMEQWRPAQRSAAGCCAIRGGGSICARADEPGAQGQQVGLLLVERGEPVPMGLDRAARAITARTVQRVRAAGTGTIRAFSPLATYTIPRAAPMAQWGVLDLCDAWEAEGGRVVLTAGMDPLERR